MAATPPTSTDPPTAVPPDSPTPLKVAAKYLTLWGESPLAPTITAAALLSHLPASRSNPSLRPSFRSSILFSSVMALSTAMYVTDPDGPTNGAGVMGAWATIYLGLHGRPRKIRSRGFAIRTGVWGLMMADAFAGIGVFAGLLGGGSRGTDEGGVL